MKISKTCIVGILIILSYLISVNSTALENTASLTIRKDGSSNESKKKNHKKNNLYKIKNPNEEKLNSQPQQLQLQAKPSDSILYVSWFVFIPLVFLIFIMTIVSIAGFFILLLNSTASNKSEENGQTRSNLTQNEILEIIRYKKYLHNKNKKHKSVYKPEPEPEGIFINK
jgi:hypothetical protein